MMSISTTWMIFIRAIYLILMIKDVTGICNEQLQHPILVKKLKDDNLRFAFNVFQNYATFRNDNVLISTIGVTSVMGMLSLSAKGKSGFQLKEIFKTLKMNGELAINQAISDVLNTLCVFNGTLSAETLETTTSPSVSSAFGSTSAPPSSSSPGNNSTIYSVTGIFIDDRPPTTVRHSFLTAVANLYNAAVSKTNLNNQPAIINQFLSNSTSRKISKISLPDSSELGFIFVNAVYLKVKWAEGFEKRFTRKWQFHVSPTRKVMVDMMGKQSEVAYTNRLDMRCRMVKVNCAGEHVSAYIILPYEAHELYNVERALTPANFRSIVASLHPTNLVLRLPKFVLEAQTNLSRVLKKMGYDEVFDEQLADLRGIFLRGNRIPVSEIFHLAKIEIDENGEKPSSSRRNFTSHPVDFTVDHPFLFIIEDQISGLILFLGRLNNPHPEH